MAALRASRLVCSRDALNHLDHLADLLRTGTWSLATTVAACSRLPAMRPLAWMLSVRAPAPARPGGWRPAPARRPGGIVVDVVGGAGQLGDGGATCSVSLRCCWAFGLGLGHDGGCSVAAEATLPLMPVRV